MSTDEIAEKALEQDADRIVIVDRWHGGPGIIRFFKAEESGLVSVPPVVHVSGIKLTRELGVSKVKPSASLVILPSETSPEMLKLAGALSKFFDVPVLLMGDPFESDSTVMSLSRDGAGRIVITFLSESKREVGPRISASDMEW
jgi:rRNA maturation protein Rpf1